ncbi:MAG: pilus assembly protein CpaB, partial [Actinobacteria bacterium]|nr:pilus assembly protein CpaB [Actinomycetota bacterium]
MTSHFPTVVAARQRVRRAVLARRRLLAALLAGVAVWAGLQAVAGPPPPSVVVTVAAHDLGGGTVVGADDVTTVEFTPASAPRALAASPVGRVLSGPVAAGEPLTESRLLGPRAWASSAAGSVALPVRLPDAGMADLLQVGDRIDLVAADPQGGAPTVVARAVSVLAVPVADEREPGRLVVVSLPEAAVPAVADAGVRT